MAVKSRSKKRTKKSGIIYFAINSRISQIVKIGMTINSAELRLKYANRKHEFMCGSWTINQKVKTNDVERTEKLAHTLFKEFHDQESVSTEMYFIPEAMTVKQMADQVREKDKIVLEQNVKLDRAKEKMIKAQAELDRIEAETSMKISLDNAVGNDGA